MFLGAFAWGARLYLVRAQAPADATEVFVVAKQWMWKLQHPGGQREIDELHVAQGQPVKLVMTSEDVIHSFFVPAFRLKQDVLPGRYTEIWFTPTEVGRFHLFCAEYCGTDHARMGGDIVVLSAADFERWLTAHRAGPDMATRGETLFRDYGCSGCHGAERGRPRAEPCGPFRQARSALRRYGTVIADERYIRDSILLPLKEVAAGYEPIMPSFAGTDRRGRHARPHRLYQEPREHPGATAMSEASLARGDNDALRDAAAQRVAHPPANYLDEGHTIRSWLTTRDHKRIAILYALSITVFFFIGGAAATLMRIELATPAGDLVTAETYNKLFTMHGVIMVWFFLIPSIPATLGNFLVPLMIGARDLAFPRLNLASWYLYVGGATVRHRRADRSAASTPDGPSTRPSRRCFPTRTSSTCSPACSSSASRPSSPASTSSSPSTSCARPDSAGSGCRCSSGRSTPPAILVLATPVLAMTLVLLAVERLFGIGIFDPRSAAIRCCSSTCSGSIRIPAVYIMVLPAMGVVSEIIACFARNPIFGYRTMAYAILAIAVDRIPRMGPSHVRVGTVDVRGHRVLAAELPRRGSVGDQGLQLDRHAVPRPHHATARRCSTRSASSACSRSGA